MMRRWFIRILAVWGLVCLFFLPLMYNGVRYVYMFDIAPYWVSRRSNQEQTSILTPIDQLTPMLEKPEKVDLTFNLSSEGDPIGWILVLRHYVLLAEPPLAEPQFMLFTCEGKPHELYITRMIKNDQGKAQPEVGRLVIKGVPHRHCVDPPPKLVLSYPD